MNSSAKQSIASLSAAYRRYSLLPLLVYRKTVSGKFCRLVSAIPLIYSREGVFSVGKLGGGS